MPSLADGLLTTGPPGKSVVLFLNFVFKVVRKCKFKKKMPLLSHPIHPSTLPCIHPPIIHSCIYSSIHPCILSIHPPTHSSRCPSVHCPFLYLSMDPSSIHVSIHASIHPSFIHLPINPSIHPSTNTSTHLLTHSSIHPSIHLSIHSLTHPSIPYPSPWQPLIHFLSVDLPVLDVSYQWSHTQCLLLCLPFSLCIVCSRSIHTVACVRASLFFMAV